MTLLNIKELSLFLKVKQSTLYAWACRGTIPCFKLNGLLRFELAEIEKWIQDSKKSAKRKTIHAKSAKFLDIDVIVKKAIDREKGKGYNRFNRKPGFNQGLRKEV